MWYHDGYELNPLMDNFLFFSKNNCRVMIIRLVLESPRPELSLGCFLIEFEAFFIILRQFEKNRYFGPMTV